MTGIFSSEQNVRTLEYLRFTEPSININPIYKRSNFSVANAYIPPIECATKMTLSNAVIASTSAADHLERNSPVIDC